MNAEKQLRSSFDRLAADKRTGVHHLALFGTLARLWKDSKYASPFAINRQRVKEASKLRSVNACDQALRELDKWAYLRYFPVESVGHRCGKRSAAQRSAAQRSAAQFNPEPEGLIRLNLTDILSSKAPKRRRLTSRVVMPRVISSQTTLFSGGGSEMIRPALGTKVVQLVIQAVVQLIIALLNKHLGLF